MPVISQSSTTDWLRQWENLVQPLQPDRDGWWSLDDDRPADWFTTLPTARKTELNQRRLQDWLYRQLISGAGDRATPEDCERRCNGLHIEFATALHAHNQGTGYWDEDWLVTAAEPDGTWAVFKQDLTIYVQPQVHLRADVQPAVGATVAVKMPKNLVEADRYMAVGDAGKPTGDRIQIYLHCDRTGVLALMQMITSRLNHDRLPFTLAVPYEPLEYPRQDAAILVMTQTDWEQVQSWQTAWKPHLLAGEPLLGRSLLPGMAIVELDHTTKNFGWDRCKLIAQGILAAPKHWPQRSQHIEQLFAAQGLDFAHPDRRAAASNNSL